MKEKDIEWFDRRIGRYYDRRYLKLEDKYTFIWYTNEPSKKWVFDIEELGLRVTLSCEETGPIKVEEKLLRKKKNKFGAYEVNTYGVRKPVKKKGEKGE